METLLDKCLKVYECEHEEFYVCEIKGYRLVGCIMHL